MSEQTLRDASALARAGLIPDLRRGIVTRAASRYPVAVTPAVAERMRASPEVARQYLPDPAELRPSPGELDDPIGDRTHSPVPGLVHRYPDRVLLTPTFACAVYCRFCFRRERVGPGADAPTPPQLANAVRYIAGRPEIREVILTGGDPLVLSPRRLEVLLGRLDHIPHLETLRIHSRVPVADPGRITPELVQVFDRRLPVYLAVHANHADEFGPAQEAALRLLARGGVPLLGQSVLLRGVNDHVEALEALFRAMLRNRIRPVYLHHPDPAPGTGHFRLTMAEGRALVRALRGRLPGPALPTYVIDDPSGIGKRPIDLGLAGPDAP